MLPQFLIVDLFCGAGGTTTGFEMAGEIAKVIACVNHDPKAIKSHWLNHPDVIHFEEDIRTLKLGPLVELVSNRKKQYPDAKLILWASLECTNFSKAKGGLPRDADSRTLADHLHRYILAINPDIIQIENVVEFMSWGPLDENGKPISKKNGTDWIRWRNDIKAHGYSDEWKELNAADFGAYTSRNRLFGMFYKDSAYLAWPEPSHTKSPGSGLMFQSQNKWKPVKEVLDFSDEGVSIFDRKKPLSDKTLERIYAGLVKYVAKGETAFISKYFSGRPAGKVKSIEDPAGAIKTIDSHCLVQPFCMLKYNSTSKTGKHVPPSINSPSPVVSTQGRLGIVFLSKYHGNGANVRSIEDPAPTLDTGDRIAAVRVEKYAQNQGIDQPAGTILPTDKHRLVEVEPFLMPTSYQNKPKSLEDPAPTIQASRRHHYLVNPSWGGNPGSVEQPSPVIIARQDKAPLYLVQVEHGQVAIGVYDEDTPTAIRVKEFMAHYSLVDIKMRMLRVHELLKIQGFPTDYKLEGNQTDQKKFIGNSVVPLVVKSWIEAIYDKTNLLQKVA